MEVDLDRLADYVGGALDGTPDAEAVRELVSTDDTWAEAYVSLVAADALVRRDLRAYGAEPAAPVPPEILLRLDRALAEAAVPLATVHRLDARRRWRKAAVGISAAAAAVVVVALAAVGVLHGLSSVSTDSAGSTAVAPEKGPLAAAGAPPQVQMTGRDYSVATLGQVGQQAARGDAGLDAPKSESGDLANSMGRLTDPTAREACVTAIVGEYGGRVSLVDFARFDGAPAMVAVVSGSSKDPAGRWIVVVGPACGSGTVDERYSGAF